MKTKKLNLNELKVKSFVTSLDGKSAQTINGGNTTSSVLVVTVVILVTMANENANPVAEDTKTDKKVDKCPTKI